MGLSGNRAVLAWSASEHASHFEVEVRSKGNTPTYFLSRSILDHMLTITGLVPDGKYQFRVKTTCENGAFSGSTRWHSFVSTMIDNEECPSPDDLSVENVTSSSADVNWSPAPNAEGYEVFLRSNAVDTVYSTMESNFNLENLSPQTDYEVQVRTLCSFGLSDDFASLQFTTQAADAPECQTPTDIGVDSITDTTALLSWTPIDTSTEYLVTWTKVGDTLSQPISTTDTSLILVDLMPASDYEVVLHQICDDTTLSESISIDFMTTGEPDSITCLAPSNLSANNITDTSAVLHWEGPEMVISFAVMVQGSSTIMEMEVEDTSVLLEGLEASTEYEVNVNSICESGSSDTTTITFTTADSESMPDSCQSPTGLAVSAADSSYDLSWVLDSLVDSVRLEVRAAADSLTIVDSNLVGTMYVFMQADSGALYEFRVSALCSNGGISIPSPWFTFPAVSDSTAFVCDPPTDLKLDTNLFTQATFSWTGSDTALYQVEVQTADTAWSFILQIDTSQATFTILDLDPGTQYSVRVRTVCDMENSEYTEFVTFETAASNCQIPDELNAEIPDDTTALLTWVGPEGAEYIIQVKDRDTSTGIDLELSSSNESVEVSGLSPNLVYQFRVASICAVDDTSDFSPWYFFTTELEICLETEGINLDTVSMTFAGLSWSGPNGASFGVEVETVDTLSNFMIATIVASPSIALDSLLPGTEYQIRVKSICADNGGESAYSDWYPFATLADTIIEEECNAPEEVLVDSVDASSVWISWTGPGAPNYEVRLTPIDSGSNPLRLVEETDESNVHFDGLDPETAYEVKVRSLCSDSLSSDYSDPVQFETSEIVEEGCPTPIGEMLVLNSESALVSWSRSSEEALYLIEVEHLGLTYTYNLINTTYDTSYLIDGLTPGGDYQWKITAFCSVDDYSECSPWMPFSTPADDVEEGCPTPTNLGAEDLGDGTVLLSWEGIEEHFDFEIEVQSLDTTSYFSQVNITSETAIQVDGLMSGGLYQFKVNALCHSSDLSEDSEWLEFILNGADTTAIHASESLVLAFPNPVFDRMTVEMPFDDTEGKTLIELTDLAGKIVLSEWKKGLITGDRMDFGVSDIREGVYKLTVRSTTEEYHQLIFIRD